jgi:HPt (histidine-containing phosphotransfer) domain-containing protein
MAAGLRQADGSRKQYLKHLLQFQTEFAGTAEELRDQLVKGETTAAGQLAGALRSAAERLGAEAVATAAGAVERAIAQPADPTEIEWLWADLEQALAPLLRELKRALKSIESAPAIEAPPVATRGEMRKALHEILPLLAEADPGAADCLDANHEVLRALFAAETFPRFVELVAAGDYAEALELLRKAAKKHGL